MSWSWNAPGDRKRVIKQALGKKIWKGMILSKRVVLMWVPLNGKTISPSFKLFGVPFQKKTCPLLLSLIWSSLLRRVSKSKFYRGNLFAIMVVRLSELFETSLAQSVGWGSRIHRLHLGKTPPLSECLGYDTKQSDGDTPKVRTSRSTIVWSGSIY